MTIKYDIIVQMRSRRSVEQIACGEGLAGTGNSLVKSLGSRKKDEEARIYPDS